MLYVFYSRFGLVDVFVWSHEGWVMASLMWTCGSFVLDLYLLTKYIIFQDFTRGKMCEDMCVMRDLMCHWMHYRFFMEAYEF